MTLIVGIICKEEIIVAAESQTTFSKYKRQDAEKITVLGFKNGSALVAQSGYTDLSCDSVDILQSRAKELEVRHPRDLPELAQKIGQELKVKQMIPYQGTGFSVREMQDYLRDNLDFHLMLAFYHNREPFIYTLNFALGSLTPIHNSHYATCGQGEALGNYLLCEYSKANMTAQLGTAIAVYVVETVIKNDSSCSGQTRIAVIRKPPEVKPPSIRLPRTTLLINEDFPLYVPGISILPAEEVQEVASLVNSVNAFTKKSLNQKLQQRLAAKTKKRLTEMLKDLYE